MGVLILQRYYSAATGGFYLEGIRDIPTDAVAISDDTFATLMDAQAAGREIRPDATGQPTAIARAFSTDEVLAQIRARRDRLLADSDFTQLPDSPLTADQRAAWASYRAALRALPETYAADPAAIVWPAAPQTATIPA